jgi:hypothetical protein
MRKNKNTLSWKATIAFIIVYAVALAWLLVPFLACWSADADVWEKLADDGTWAVIIAVFLEFPEIAAKTSIGLRLRFAWFRLLLIKINRFKIWHDWLEKHEFQIDVLALCAWVFIMIGLMVELRTNQIARGIQDAAFSNVAKEAADANLLAAQTESNNLVLRSNVATLEAAVQWRTITPGQEAELVKKLKPINDASRIKKTIAVRTDDEDIEETTYARRIAAVLSNCGYNSFWANNLGSINPRPAPIVGMFFTVKSLKDAAKIPSPAYEIIPAFNALKIDFKVVEDPEGGSDGDITIRVGHKPK